LFKKFSKLFENQIDYIRGEKSN